MIADMGTKPSAHLRTQQGFQRGYHLQQYLQRIFYLNLTKYSVTTSVHQSAIYVALRRAYPDAIFVIFRDLPRGVQDLKSLYPSDEYEYTIEERVA